MQVAAAQVSTWRDAAHERSAPLRAPEYSSLPPCHTPVFASGRLTRLAPAASLAAAASGVQRPLQPGGDGLSLKQKPELSDAPEPDSIPWNKFTERAVLHFWTTRGVLVPEPLWQSPGQAVRQKALTGKLRRWAAASPRHRDVYFLEQYMAAWDAAAAALGSNADVDRLVLASQTIIAKRLAPVRILQNVQLVRGVFADAGLAFHLYRAPTLVLGSATALAERLPQLLTALQGWLDADAVAALVEAAPRLLWADMAGLGPRLAALQQLHPDFNAAAAIARVDALLGLRPELVAAKWRGIQAAAHLDDAQMAVLMNYDPTPLAAKLDTLEWRLSLFDLYERRRRASEAESPDAPVLPGSRRGRQLQFPSWLANVLKVGVVRFRRLEYLLSIGSFDKKAYTIVRESDAEFTRRHPEFIEYVQWPGPKQLGKPTGGNAVAQARTSEQLSEDVQAASPAVV